MKAQDYQTPLKGMEKLIPELYIDLESRFNARDLGDNIHTVEDIHDSFQDIEVFHDTLKKGCLRVIDGTSLVKSSYMAIELVLQEVFQKKHAEDSVVAIFSLGMAAQDIVKQMLASMSSVELARLYDGCLTSQDWIMLANAVGALVKSDIYIDDTASVSADEIYRRCQQLKLESPGQALDLVVVGHLQLASSTNQQQKHSNTSNMIESLTNTAHSLDVSLVAVAS